MQAAEPVTAPLAADAEGVPSHPSYLARKYFGSLDLFRFLAIIGVIWHHTEDGSSRFPASQRGFLGVDFFFVISGFLIVTLLLRERDRTGSIALGAFYLRRTLRIFPIYYAMLGALTVFFVLVKPGSSMARPFLAELPYQATYLSNFLGESKTILFFTWSLATEEQFYLVWPPVEKWLGRLVVPLLLGVIGINQAINFGLLNPWLGDAQSRLNILQITFTPICLGVLLAHALHDPRWYGRLATWLGRPWMSVVLALAVLLACNNPRPDLLGWPRLLIQGAMTFWLASCVIREDNRLNRGLGFRWVRRIGVISYGMYLYHEFAAHAAREALKRLGSAPSPTFFLLTTALTVVLAELSFRLYETPFLRLKDRWGHGSRALRADFPRSAVDSDGSARHDTPNPLG